MRDFIKKRLSLAITLVMFVFGVMVATFCLIGGSFILLQHLGIISLSAHTTRHSGETNGNPLLSLFLFIVLCILLGTALTAFLSRKALNPIRKVIDATHKVANGDFNVQVNIKGIGELEELSQSFNKMTQELSSIETLRSDFINNFSHEFKTPIVSLRGFAKLLRENHLTEEERREYLDIIITESERLAALSTNVLTLAKYENLEIIVDKTPFRLDEQIRRTIVLMEPKWSAKDITMNVELDEVIYNGNDELTQQIWLNLLDNAIKFSHHGGAITLTLTNVIKGIQLVIQDEGTGMDCQTKAHIFDKFYQGDTSHSKSGYGLGLPLVKRIVNLCGGSISVQSEQGEGSTFTIELPY
ncbi:HAMP domain-containing sensor histidine kinase [Pullulanibacillus sp. KACC 23026]|uniref:HAMP domain-containing sensor histidine kinase n=1 Tax=Pullulanibacillus sp. KACC 23026 TaxID=3028315 RepID=UPI0023B0CC77|nr:HAMP domain-containing sensor histidine kinase [Pullulanibacillus sp. KACC 23026]WEG12223.1 HAMP domain-containing sensor histidine kinase [Pullulanibacillus sp. KACC 23026]